MNIQFISEHLEKRKMHYYLQRASLRLRVSPDVYEPHDDSFILAKAAEKHAFGRLLDLGCGTGIIGLSASKNVDKIVFADVLAEALKICRKNVEENNLRTPVEFIQTKLFSSLSGAFDTIAFNPPYLPTLKEEKLEEGINYAFDGGEDGRRVLDVFLDLFDAHLSPNGILLLLNSSISAKDGESGNQITRERLERKGFNVEVVERQRFFFEELVVFKARRL